MDFFIALIAVAAISMFFVVRYKLNAAVAPFFTVMAITLAMCMLCMVGLLAVAGWVIYVFAIFCIVYVFVLKKTPVREVTKNLFTPGMVFFLMACTVLYVGLSIKSPAFIIWDEFSFWGTAAKAIFENRQMYTMFESSMINRSYPPALPIWSFFIQFFGRSFVEWKVYLAYDVMIMAVMSMLFSRVKWKNVASVVIFTVFGLTSLYTFWHTFEGTYLYTTSYADLQIGVLFGGVIMCYFWSDKDNLMRWVMALVGVMTLPMVKDIGFALAFVACGIILVDTVISGNYPTEKLFNSSKKIARAVLPMLLFAGVLLVYQLWAIHFQATQELSRAADPYEYSIVQMLAGQDERFNGILKSMLDLISVRQIVLFGTIKVMAVVLTVVPVLVSILTLDKKKIIRVGVFSLLMLGGFAAYYLFHAYAYAAIFRNEIGLQLESYQRYISSYCIGWLLASVGVCAFEITVPKIKKCRLVAAATVAALVFSSTFYYSFSSKYPHVPHPDQYFFTSSKIDVKSSEIYGIRLAIREQLGDLKNEFDHDDRFYFICQQSDGGEWFLYNYEMMPAYTVGTYGGGNFVAPGTAEGTYDIETTRADFIAYLRAEEVDYVHLFKLDDYFYEEFAPMFSDYISGYADRTAYIYMVVDNGGDDFMLVPVRNAEDLQQQKALMGVE